MKILKATTILLAAASLSACATLTSPSTPGAVANSTVLDEKVAIAAELAYQAASLSATTARRAHLIDDEKWLKVKAIDIKAYAAVGSVRAAYKAGNAVGYVEAFSEAQRSLNLFLESVR